MNIMFQVGDAMNWRQRKWLLRESSLERTLVKGYSKEVALGKNASAVYSFDGSL